MVAVRSHHRTHDGEAQAQPRRRRPFPLQAPEGLEQRLGTIQAEPGREGGLEITVAFPAARWIQELRTRARA
jgi:hypothetical protein